MSDESTIAASSLLASVFNATPSTSQLPPASLLDSEGILGAHGEAGTFKQLLQSNFDADNDSFNLSAARVTSNSFLTGTAKVTESELSTTEPHLTRSVFTPNELLNTAQNQNPNGNHLPLTGNLLPPQTAGEDAGILLTNESGPTALVTLDHQRPAADAERREPMEFTGQVAAFEETELQPDSGNQQSTIALSLQTPPPASAAAPIEHSGVRTRESSAAPVTPGTTVNTSSSTAELTPDNSSDSGQGERDGHQWSEAQLEIRSQRSVTAEFARDANPAVDGQNEYSLARTADVGSNPLTALTQTSAPTQPLATTSLTLSADRQVAGQQVAQHLATFVRQGDDQAEITLAPPHLGKISARITVQNDQASVILTAPSPEIREIIEASLPRLGDLLEQSGLTLADANVSSENQNEANSSAATETSDTASSEDSSDPSVPAPREYVRGLLDAYA